MNDDRFTNLGKEISHSVEHILNSSEFTDLKNTIRSAIDQVDHIIPPGTAPRNANPFSHSNPAQTKPPIYYEKDGTIHEGPVPHSVRHSYKNVKLPGSGSSVFAIAFGILGLVVMIPLTILSFVTSMVFPSAFAWLPTSGMVIGSAVMAALTGWGFHRNGRVRRLRKYLNYLENRTYCSFEDLAENSQLPAQTVQKDMLYLTDRELIPGAHIDDKETCVILNEETYSLYKNMQENQLRLQKEEEARKEELEKNPQAAALAQTLQEGEDYIGQIRHLNDLLPGEEISEKLDTLENTCRQLFSYVKQNPSKLPQLRKFMCYYLPMVLKLVEAYHRMETSGVQSQSAENSKAEILQALDNINLAFQNLLHRLMENDFMNLSADISVLETMLAQEGLTDDPNNLNMK